jgi:4-hydroxyphenylacetate 3-monooxygenase
VQTASEAGVEAGTIKLLELGTATEYELRPTRLVIAGFTGRRRDAVAEHLEELRALGVAIPDRTPAFYQVDPGLLTTATRIGVAGAFTSGEVEPVIIVHQGRLLLTVGSDHTDRDLERSSIEQSKQACPKVIGTGCVGMERVKSWDQAELSSSIDGEPEPYQRGRLESLLGLEALLEEGRSAGIELRDGDVVFLGTIPTRDGALRPGKLFRGTLRLVGEPTPLTVEYTVDLIAGHPDAPPREELR